MRLINLCFVKKIFTNKRIKVSYALFSRKTETISNNVERLHKLHIFLVSNYVFIWQKIEYNDMEFGYYKLHRIKIIRMLKITCNKFIFTI